MKNNVFLSNSAKNLLKLIDWLIEYIFKPIMCIRILQIQRKLSAGKWKVFFSSASQPFTGFSSGESNSDFFSHLKRGNNLNRWDTAGLELGFTRVLFYNSFGTQLGWNWDLPKFSSMYLLTTINNAIYESSDRNLSPKKISYLKPWLNEKCLICTKA